MAATITPVTRGHLGIRRAVLVTLKGDTSYPTGGYSLKPADVALSTFDAVFVDAPAGYVASYDYTNQKVIFYWDRAQNAAAGVQVEVTAATDVSGTTFRVLAIGTGN